MTSETSDLSADDRELRITKRGYKKWCDLKPSAVDHARSGESLAECLTGVKSARTYKRDITFPYLQLFQWVVYATRILKNIYLICVFCWVFFFLSWWSFSSNDSLTRACSEIKRDFSKQVQKDVSQRSKQNDRFTLKRSSDYGECSKWKSTCVRWESILTYEILGSRICARAIVSGVGAAKRVVIRTVNSGLASGLANLVAGETGRNHVFNYQRVVASTLRRTRERVRLRDVARDRPRVDAPRERNFSRFAELFEEEALQWKEITFGTESLHYCPREIYVWFLFSIF